MVLDSGDVQHAWYAGHTFRKLVAWGSLMKLMRLPCRRSILVQRNACSCSSVFIKITMALSSEVAYRFAQLHVYICPIAWPGRRPSYCST